MQDLQKKDRWITALLVLTLLLCMGISWPLWLPNRPYPLAPLIDFPSQYLSALHLPALLLFLFCLFLYLIPNRKVTSLNLGLFVSSAALVALDQSRLQPWFFQYVLMILVWNEAKDKEEIARDTLKIMISAIYFWSGVNKLNSTFATQGLAWFLQPFLDVKEFLIGQPLLGLIPGLIETGLALALWHPRFSRLAVFGCIALHTVILLCLTARDWNWVVWPWNLSQALMVYLLFSYREHTSSQLLNVLQLPHVLRRAVILIFLLLPVLNFFGYWDSYLSSSLYSERTAYGYISFKEADPQIIPAPIRQALQYNDRNEPYLDLDQWSVKELKVPSYPEKRVFLKIFSRICKSMEKGSKITLEIDSPPEILSGRIQTEIFHCPEDDSR